MPGVGVRRGALRCLHITPAPTWAPGAGPAHPMGPPSDTRPSALPAIGDLRPRPWRPSGTRRLPCHCRAPRRWARTPPPPRPCPGRPTRPEPCAAGSSPGPSPSTCCSCNRGPPLPPGPATGRRGQDAEGRRQQGLQQRLNGIFVYFWEVRWPVWGNTFGPAGRGPRTNPPAPRGPPAEEREPPHVGVSGTGRARPPKL